MCVDAHGAPALDRGPKPTLRELSLERERLVQAALVSPRDGHRGNRVMPQFEALCVRRAGCLDPGGHRLAELRCGDAVRRRGPLGTRAKARPRALVQAAVPRRVAPARARPGQRSGPGHEVPISLAEPLLGPSASQRRCLARQVGPRGVDDREPVAASHQSDPKTRELVVKSPPGSDAIELPGVSYRSTRPPRETLDAPVRLEVAGPVALGTTSRSVDAVQPKLLFEDARKRLKRADGLIRVMDLQRLRMDLVDRHVKMLVLLLAMANRDVLVLSEPRRRARPGGRRPRAPPASGVGPRGETR